MAPLVPAPAHGQMILPGKFDVTEQGSASYAVPISVPPGTAGLQPKLDLVYDSRSGNGLMGVGWSLAGLPAITRCARTIAQDGVSGGVTFENTDRFCLDGQRLVAISGAYGAPNTEYRTEREGYSRIVSKGTAGSGPAWFEVWTKAGLVLEFGNTADSRIDISSTDTAKHGSARVWALNKTRDSKNNYFIASYIKDATNGEYRPDRIDYTGNTAASKLPFASVRFVYEDRTDKELAYLSGSQIKQTKRLSKIQTYLQTPTTSTQVSEYRLAYEYSPLNERSRIINIKLCDAANNCMPQTTFAWQGDVQLVDSAATLADGPKYTDCNAGLPAYGDWNGDGRVDFICRNGTTEYVVLSSAAAVFAQSIATISAPSPSIRKVIVGDWNGDGKSDFLTHYPGGATNVSVYLINPAADGVITSSFAPGTWADYEISVGDFNGDGRSDLFLKARIAGVASKIMLSDGAGSFTDSGYSSPTGWNTQKVTLADFDGDGQTDMVLYPPSGNGTLYLTRWSAGALSFNSSTVTNAGYSDQSFEASDLNGDGYADLFIRSNTGASRVLLSDGTGIFVTYSPFPTSFPPFNYYGMGGEATGDTTADLIHLNQTTAYHSGGCNYEGVCTPEVFTNSYTYTSRKLFADRIASRQILAYSQLGTQYGAPTEYLSLVDYTGDGLPDYNHSWTTTIQVYECCNWEGAGYYVPVTVYHHAFHASLRRNEAIKEITSGSGAITKIAYDRLTTTVSGFYAKDTGALACTFPCVDVSGPIYVVSEVKTSNGIGGEYRSTYRYAGAKGHVHGRGFLGFRQMIVRDEQAHTLKENPVGSTGQDSGQYYLEQVSEYLQEYPYAGLLSKRSKRLVRTSGETVPLNTTTNCYSNDTLSVDNGGGLRRLVKLDRNEEQSWDLPAIVPAAGPALPTVKTTYLYGTYGNTDEVAVLTGSGASANCDPGATGFTPDGFSKTTKNWYSNDESKWFLGRLTRAEVHSVTP